MAAPVNLTIDGQKLQASPGTLLINAAKQAGISIPAFCYYDGLALQAACRMCLVEVEKTPKLQVACTLPVAEGMVVRTDSPQVRQARKGMLEFLLTNHPLDCPVCDKGGECELQDMVFRYGAGQSRFIEPKVHVDEKQWSPIVYYDAPRCILCYRCVRICGEGLGVSALGIGNRGVVAEIVPNRGDHLECDECGACIDICPVGALTSGTYRYKARPWEMDHVGTICTHCSNGCKTTLGIRNGQILRANSRDHSGINGEFLCVKGRYAFDFNEHPGRLTSPLVRSDGEFKPVSWAQALAAVAQRFTELRVKRGNFAVIGSNHTTNEENFLLQKFAREVLRTSNIDHHRTGDVAGLIHALDGRTNVLASTDDLYNTKAALVISSDLAQEQPLLAFQLRANWRHHKAHVYAVTPGPVREDNYATTARAEPGNEFDVFESMRERLAKEPELVILFGDAIKGGRIARLVSFGDSLGIPVKYVCLVDYSNSRGASDMGLLPHLLPGYRSVSDSGLEPGLNYDQILAAADLDALWIVGANPLARQSLASPNAFLVVQDLFLTETARQASVVLPAASAYEKNGTFTNVCGDVQKLSRAAKTMGTKSDLEIIALLAKEMRQDFGAAKPEVVFDEIRRSVRGYDVPLTVIETGGAAKTVLLDGRPQVASRNGHFRVDTDANLIRSARNTLFTSGTLGRFSQMLSSVIEAPGALYRDPRKQPEVREGSVQVETVKQGQ
ncbi:MAG: NADH-quinone oxidoreductase subunit NuoG [Acidobacteriaceae bacterium]|nr:NADH-quinone oxidoreductase subunit NuoG [Acidobacteriaceae bacterium]MBV9779617.1 NADH-quinone oxidoreductase subunit NuoG [Acidobacteriaceae bacterium]